MAGKGEHLGWLKKGKGFLEWKQYRQAIAAFDKAIKAKPNFVEAWAEKSKALMELGEFDQALQVCDKVIQLQPQNPDGWCTKATVLERADRLEEAQAAFQAAVDKFPEPATMFIYSLFLDRCGQHEAVLPILNQLLEMEDIEPMIVLTTRSQALESLGRYQEALSDLERVLAYGEFHMLNYRQGILLEQLERYEEALIAYQKATLEAPECEDYWLGRGLLLEKLEQFDEALDWYDRSIGAIGEVGWLMRGQLLQRLKRYEESLDAFDQVLTLVPNHASAFYDRAVCLSLKGDPTEAKIALERAVAINPEFKMMALEDPAFEGWIEQLA